VGAPYGATDHAGPTAAMPTAGAPSPADWASSMATQPPQAPRPAPAGTASALDELRADEEDVRRQVATLRDTVAVLRDAAQAMDNERIELQSFLDGSHDALERLEDGSASRWGWTCGVAQRRCVGICRCRSSG